MVEKILNYVINSLVKHQKDVVIKKEVLRGRTSYKIYINKEDMGKVIGRNRMTLNAIRTLCNAFSGAHNHPRIDIVRDYDEDEIDASSISVNADEPVGSSNMNTTAGDDAISGLEDRIETV